MRLKPTALVVLLLTGLSVTVWAQVYSPLRTQTNTGLITQLCHSRLPYSLIDPSAVDSPTPIADLMTVESNRDAQLSVASDRFHTLVGCLVDDAVLTTLETAQEQSQQALQVSEFTTQPTFIDTQSLRSSSTCPEGILAQTLAIQTESRLQNDAPHTDLCTTDPTNHPFAERTASACRVTQAILTEWCGYQLWLGLYLADETGARAEWAYEQTIFGEDAVAPFNTYLTQRQAAAETEREHTQTTIEHTLAWYTQFVQDTYTHTALQSASAATQQFSQSLSVLDHQFQSLPPQFHNAMANQCQ